MPKSTLPHTLIAQQVANALAEDLGNGDLTAQLIPAENLVEASIISREEAVICGQDWVDEVFAQTDSTITIDWAIAEGERVSQGQLLCSVKGPARALLTAERTALNFLQTLSGTATVTASYVSLLGDSPVRLLDTRKTIPGLREAQKYAVKCGGGYNHRHGLFDGVLIKENHILASGSITAAVEQAKSTIPHGIKVEVEVETLEEVKEAVEAGADILLLDNMSLAMITQAVELVAGRAKLEVSGNITAETIQPLLETGIDYISTGAITKHVKAVDLSMRFT